MAIFLDRANRGERNFTHSECKQALQEAMGAYSRGNLKFSIEIVIVVATVLLNPTQFQQDPNDSLRNEINTLRGRIQSYEKSHNIDPGLIAKLKSSVDKLDGEIKDLEAKVKEYELKEKLDYIARRKEEVHSENLKNTGKWAGTTVGTGAAILTGGAFTGPLAAIIIPLGLFGLAFGAIRGGDNLKKERDDKIAAWNEVEGWVKAGGALEYSIWYVKQTKRIDI